MTLDALSPAAAAADLPGQGSTAGDEATSGGTPSPRRRRYPNPDDYKDHPLARRIDAGLDKLSPDGSASTACGVGAAAAATAATMGSLDLHPGWYLIVAVTMYSGTCAIGWWRAARTGAPATRPDGGGGRFSGLTAR